MQMPEEAERLAQLQHQYDMLKNAYDELLQQRAQDKWPRTEAPRVMVACVGDRFMDGCKDAILLAAQRYTETTRGGCDVYILASLTVLPPLGLGAMRNFCIERACLNGYDYLMIVDNDVRLDDADTLVKLVNRGREYVVPFFDQTPLKIVHRIADPMYKQNQGLLKLSWTTPYLNLIACQIFRRIGYRPFTDSMIYNEDEYNSHHFRCYGVTIWQDTDTAVTLLRGPGLLCDTLKDLKVVPPGGYS